MVAATTQLYGIYALSKISGIKKAACAAFFI
jgi:hypothetical protein